MSCYLDTTVVCAVAENDASNAPKCQAFIDTHQPALVPYYALRELLAGPLKSVCAAYSRLNAAGTVQEAFQSVLSLPNIVGRTKSGQMQALIAALGEGLEVVGAQVGPGQVVAPLVKRRMLYQMAIEIQSQWAKARTISGARLAQPLACFVDGDFEFLDTGELKAPNDRFSCNPAIPCSAADHLKGKLPEVNKIVAALHPKRLGADLGKKRENVRRRSALKELERFSKKRRDSFPKKDCRALGDAYFAIMCPPGSPVVSTNLVDYDILCQVLGKTVTAP